MNFLDEVKNHVGAVLLGMLVMGFPLFVYYHANLREPWFGGAYLMKYNAQVLIIIAIVIAGIIAHVSYYLGQRSREDNDDDDGNGGRGDDDGPESPLPTDDDGNIWLEEEVPQEEADKTIKPRKKYDEPSASGGYVELLA